jgi:DNA-binding NtrC family response regulator
MATAASASAPAVAPVAAAPVAAVVPPAVEPAVVLPAVAHGAGPVAPAAPAGDEQFLLARHLEQQHILDALKKTGGNRTQAAAILKISIRTLRNKLNLYREQGVAVSLIGQDEGE